MRISDWSSDVCSSDLFGHDEMNRHAVAPDIFDAARYPTATFKGRFTDFDGSRPEAAEGEFTLRGVTRPLKLDIDDFKCIQHPMEKREVCGADVSRSEEHTSELQSLMRISYAVFCLKKKKKTIKQSTSSYETCTRQDLQ